MKKRIISVLLATVFALSVIGCGTKDTKEQDAYRQYGITCMESGKYEDAVKAFQNALGESIGHIGEKELDICFYKAKAQALDGKTKDALATYNAIIKYNKDARAYYLRGDLYMDMGEEKKGRADFESAVQQGKKNYEIYIGIYESLSRHEKKDEGQKYLSAAMEIKGDKPEDELYKGRISYLLGENKDAISYLEKAKELEVEEDDIEMSEEDNYEDDSYDKDIDDDDLVDDDYSDLSIVDEDELDSEN